MAAKPYVHNGLATWWTPDVVHVAFGAFFDPATALLQIGPICQVKLVQIKVLQTGPICQVKLVQIKVLQTGPICQVKLVQLNCYKQGPFVKIAFLRNFTKEFLLQSYLDKWALLVAVSVALAERYEHNVSTARCSPNITYAVLLSVWLGCFHEFCSIACVVLCYFATCCIMFGNIASRYHLSFRIVNVWCRVIWFHVESCRRVSWRIVNWHHAMRCSALGHKIATYPVAS